MARVPPKGWVENKCKEVRGDGEQKVRGDVQSKNVKGKEIKQVDNISSNTLVRRRQ